MNPQQRLLEDSAGGVPERAGIARKSLRGAQAKVFVALAAGTAGLPVDAR